MFLLLQMQNSAAVLGCWGVADNNARRTGSVSPFPLFRSMAAEAVVVVVVVARHLPLELKYVAELTV